jgi:quercetin dioxygenase-like cupin family protein
MPTINKRFALASGDSLELLETSAMTGGAYVRARFVFGVGGLRAPAHIHPLQEEKFEILSGRLTYFLDGKKYIAETGTTVTLPPGVVHQHYCEDEKEAAITIETVTPGLDWDYLVENLFGLGAEGNLTKMSLPIFLIMQLATMKSAFYGGSIKPLWLQKLVAKAVTPLLHLFGYRVVHERFSGEEW